jgi:glycerate 2-kinase
VTRLRERARAIWDAAVAAVRPEELVRGALTDPALGVVDALARCRRVVVMGAGKAGAAMSAALEDVLRSSSKDIVGVVNVPAETVRPLRWIRLHAARPAGTNQPTAEGIAGARRILELAGTAGADDIGICLISGGGSALLPAPAAGVTLADKQHVTRLLHACGATINEMNAVRKHLSVIKGGRLGQAFTGKALFSLIISDVVNDPLDVIASGPTAPDPTTFADALHVLKKYALGDKVPETVWNHLQSGLAGDIAETPKMLPAQVQNHIIGNNARALAAASAKAAELGYRVVNLGSGIEGETREVAFDMVELVRKQLQEGQPRPPLCLLSGGETTVTLGPDHGQGGRNQEFVLAALTKLSAQEMNRIVILSGGTDGEDGPSDAAGAIVDAGTLSRADERGLVAAAYLERHDAYHYFQTAGDLLRTGLTGTNVMDVRVILVAG